LGKIILTPLFMVAVLAGLAAGALALLHSDTVDAGGHGATRSFSAQSVVAGGELVVTIDTSGSGLGQVVETLPAGFTYDSSSLLDAWVNVEGQTVTFNLLSLGDEFTYTVTAPDVDVEEEYTFRGVVADSPPEGQPIDDRSIGGFSDVTVTVGNGQTSSPMPAPQPSGASATRTIATTINAGEEVTVTITVADYGGYGEVVEVLPEGFTYVSTTHQDLLREGQRLSFSLLGEENFSYTVTAPTRTGSYNFDGTLTDSQLMETRVGGVFAVTVQTPALPRGPATRSFSPSPVNPGGQLTVTITLGNYGGVGEVVEVLPEGFTYVSTTHEDLLREGQRLSFSLLGEENFSYTVTAPTRTGS
jgi:hypothetical protein